MFEMFQIICIYVIAFQTGYASGISQLKNAGGILVWKRVQIIFVIYIIFSCIFQTVSIILLHLLLILDTTKHVYDFNHDSNEWSIVIYLELISAMTSHNCNYLLTTELWH